MPRYVGPYRVVAKSGMTLTLLIDGRTDIVSRDRCKPWHQLMKINPVDDAAMLDNDDQPCLQDLLADVSYPLEAPVSSTRGGEPATPIDILRPPEGDPKISNFPGQRRSPVIHEHDSFMEMSTI